MPRIALSARHSHCYEQRHSVYLWDNQDLGSVRGTLAGMELAARCTHQQSLVEIPI